jgi:hypothetical protein
VFLPEKVEFYTSICFIYEHMFCFYYTLCLFIYPVGRPVRCNRKFGGKNESKLQRWSSIVWEAMFLSDTVEYRKNRIRVLMAKHGQDVWNYAFSLCKRQEVADDITQDVM